MNISFKSSRNDDEHSSQFKELMAQVPTSVAVVAVSTAGHIRACTISSFMSVDILDPTIMFILKNDSRTLEGILTENIFSINLLLSDQENLSRTYASIERDSEDDTRIHWKTNENGVPLLITCKSSMVCQFVSVTELQAATVVFARVVELEILSHKNPLIYYARTYPSILES